MLENSATGEWDAIVKWEGCDWSTRMFKLNVRCQSNIHMNTRIVQDEQANSYLPLFMNFSLIFWLMVYKLAPISRNKLTPFENTTMLRL